MTETGLEKALRDVPPRTLLGAMVAIAGLTLLERDGPELVLQRGPLHGVIACADQRRLSHRPERHALVMSGLQPTDDPHELDPGVGHEPVLPGFGADLNQLAERLLCRRGGYR